jgi:hypothetical protein
MLKFAVLYTFLLRTLATDGGGDDTYTLGSTPLKPNGESETYEFRILTAFSY